MAPNGIAITSPPNTATRIEPVSFLLICGILSSLLYAAMNVFIPMRWDGYSSASQAVSELAAIGAPTRALWVFLGTIYTLLFAAFGWGVWRAAEGNRFLRLAGAVMIVDGFIGLFWPPMHLRGTGLSLTDTLHIVWTIATLVLMMLAIGFAAVALGRRFRLYSVVTIVIFVVFGVLTGLDGPRIAANLPTPWVGVWERINIGAFLLWVVVLAVALLRTRRASEWLRGGGRWQPVPSTAPTGLRSSNTSIESSPGRRTR